MWPPKSGRVGGSVQSVPVDLRFAGATLSACQAAREAFFSANPARRCEDVAVVLQPTGAEPVLQTWVGSSWLDQSSVIQGPKGDKGDKGETGDVGPMYSPKGSYVASTAYAERDAVFYQGSTYYCKVACVGHAPTETAYWGILAEKGDTGISGLTWRGVYSAATAYAVNDVVEYDNAGTPTVYVCIAASTGVVPTNTAKWNPLPIRGARGDIGPTGPTGPAGPTGPSGNGDVGDVKMNAGAAAPTGWLKCDGLAVSRATYSALFAVIGTLYGAGDGSTTFNLPNFKGRVPVGVDAAQTEFATLGKVGGAKTHTLSELEMPVHKHQVNDTYGVQYSAGTWTDTSACDEISRTEDTTTAGGGQAHNNLQPYIAINFVIKH